MKSQVFYTEWENVIETECIRLVPPTHQALRSRVSFGQDRVLVTIACVLDTRSRPSFAADSLNRSRDGPIFSEAGISILRRAYPFQGGPIHPEAGLFIPRRDYSSRDGLVHPEVGLSILRWRIPSSGGPTRTGIFFLLLYYSQA